VLAAFLLLFIVIDRFSGPGGEGQPSGGGAASRATTSTAGAATTTLPPTTVAPTTTARPTTTTAPGTTRPPATRPPATTRLRSADGVTVQILNGTGELRIARDFKPLVNAEGYRVVNTANANGNYRISTVFYTPGHRPDAEAFRARFPAFRIVEPARPSLSNTVAIHVVIGENYRP
jgi:hypothetical protein